MCLEVYFHLQQSLLGCQGNGQGSGEGEWVGWNNGCGGKMRRYIAHVAEREGGEGGWAGLEDGRGGKMSGMGCA